MIVPLPGYILVHPIEEQEQTSSGLFTPETTKEKPMKGLVVSVSEGAPVKPHQTVIHKKWVNEALVEDGKEYMFVKFEDLIGVVENETT